VEKSAHPKIMRIYLSQSETIDGLSDIGGEVVLLHPDHDKWNDFNLRLYAMITIYRSGVKIWSSSLRMYIENERESAAWLHKMLCETDQKFVPIETVKSRFITAQLAKSQYSDLRQTIGLEGARELLARIHDLPTLRTEFSDAKDLELTKNKEYFFGFARTNNSYIISESDSYRLLFGGLEGDALSDVRAFWASYECLSSEGTETLVFDCSKTALEKNRIAVLVGMNGIGKTRTLVESAHIVCNSISTDLIEEREVRSLGNVGFQRVVFVTSTTLPTPLPQAAKTIKIGSRGPQDLERTKAISIIARNVEGLTLSFLRKFLVEAIDNFEVELPMMDGGYSLIRSFIGERDRLEFCANVDLSKPLRFADSNGNPRSLSSGEECLVDLALLVSAQTMPNSLILVDEPENSMHPKFISAAISILRAILLSQNSFCILATHSALVVREVESLSVHIFQRRESKIAILRPALQTFGENLSLINDLIFDDRSTNKSYEKVIDDAIDNSSNPMNLDSDIQTLLGANALNYYHKAKEMGE
jgi:energy-coupling factor transporter ATP-binding protein EcfA2